MPFDIPDFESLMQLDDAGGDAFVGRSPSYPWGRVYGGQVVAQALRAATRTVAPDRFVHSLHVQFVRGGDSELPIRYAVTRVRDGGSFSLRNVEASQAGATIMQLSASFQLDESQTEVDVQVDSLPAGLPAPEALPTADWGPMLERRPIELAKGRAAYWLRVAGDAVARGSRDAGLRARLTPRTTSRPRRRIRRHPLRAGVPDTPTAYDAAFVGASLDHAIWFHRRGRFDEWVLHDFQGSGVAGARGARHRPDLLPRRRPSRDRRPGDPDPEAALTLA
jgi:acyl-CoA thioesterase-2